MKSLKEPKFTSTCPEFFPPDVMRHILSEGFEEQDNDSYCYVDSCQEEWEPRCYRKSNGYDRYGMLQYIYIFPNGIGVDTDYDCGGNCSNVFWPFEDRSFEEVYDMMVDYVNERR